MKKFHPYFIIKHKNLFVFKFKRLIKNSIFKFKSIFFYIINFHKSPLVREKNSAVYIWDARTNSITFDFADTLYDAHKFFLRHGFNSFDLIIYLPKGHIVKPFKFRNYSLFVSSAEMHQRIINLIIPLAESCKCIKRLKKIDSKKELIHEINSTNKLIFPINYNPTFFNHDAKNDKLHFKNIRKEVKPITFPGFEVDNKKVDLFKELNLNLDNSKTLIKNYITITLRDYGFAPLRNTNNEDLKIAAEFASNKNAKLIIVPDSISNLKKYSIPNDSIIYKKARIFIKERIALYKNSLVNLFSNSGTLGVSIFTNGAKAIQFRHGNGDPSDPLCDCSPLYFKIFHNIEYGEQPFLKFDTFLLWDRPNKSYNVNDLKNALNIIEKNY